MWEIKMWFLYGYNGFKSHAKDKDLVDLVMYLHCEPDGTFRQFYDSDSNWRLILSENNCWIWKTDIQELMTVPIENLIFMPQRRYIRYKHFSSIEKKYLKDPCSIDEIIECLEFKNSFQQHSYS